ncbi:MAG: glycosyltransferase family 4 protein [Patescibacteria group bacterium]
MNKETMKICLYLEFYHFLNGWLFKKVGTGLLSSYNHQKNMLNHLGIAFTEKWDDSCDILQTNTPWLYSVYLIKKAKRAGKKVIIWSHTTMEDAMQVFRFMPFIAPLFKKYLTYAYGLADMVFCPSEYTKGLLMAYGLPENKLMVRSNGVDLKRIYQDRGKRESGRALYGLNTLTVGTQGLVIPRKGIDTFLLMAKKFPDHQFIWFGKIYSKLLVKSLPAILPKNVRFTGFVPDADICSAFNALDVFLFPSYEENQGISVLEAAAAGLPVVVRDIPVYNGWLIHEENCLKAKTDEEFERYINMLLDDKNLRDKLGHNAQALSRRESVETLAASLEKIYKDIITNY